MLKEYEGDLILEVGDDGQGFQIDDVPELSRYGLRGMRERAELIGADFQVISRPGEGTVIYLRLPARSWEVLTMKSARIRLVVVDDHALFRRGLVGLLKDMLGI